MRTKLIALVVVFLSFQMKAFAAGAAPSIVNGGVQLLTDALSWVLLLLPPAMGVVIGGIHIKKITSGGEPGTVAECNKWMKVTLISGAVGEGAAGLVTTFLSYFH